MTTQPVPGLRSGLLRDHPDLVRLVAAYLAIADGRKQTIALDFVIRLAEIERSEIESGKQRANGNSAK